MAHLTMRAVDLLDEQAKLAVLKDPQTTNAHRSAASCKGETCQKRNSKKF